MCGIIKVASNTDKWVADFSHLSSILLLLQKMKSSSVSLLISMCYICMRLTGTTELLWGIIQVTGPLFDCIRHSVSW